MRCRSVGRSVGRRALTEPRCAQLAELVMRLDSLGYRGDYSFEVFNDDYLQMPVDIVAQRARDAAMWVAAQSERRSLPRTLVRSSH